MCQVTPGKTRDRWSADWRLFLQAIGPDLDSHLGAAGYCVHDKCVDEINSADLKKFSSEYRGLRYGAVGTIQSNCQRPLDLQLESIRMSKSRIKSKICWPMQRRMEYSRMV